ncbi:thiamine pyrophosphate-dependent enzyme [Bradyrhizobium sp. 6(2017)]|uniref:thiamine pyrophosphate-dependent enzyme n=1 Tax=Bradyrhizobium sp. 6(2017) TaxID=1197460 RepID=UPI0013E1DC83|nr:thiamine pyrophosphate-dependent enzyme [Bradyrhizobium sp. 6(2017)]QIG95946.1 ubiquinone-dependent pyruvate dehydrogenase [Bradyrhizobium sp. 6(2017)]
MSKQVADIIVETLQSAGVRHCYGVVGDTLNLIARSLERSTIEWVSVRHEEAGAFAAQAEAQVTGHLTAVAGSCGPGSLHFINGIFEANRNRAPVVLIASQIIRDELGFDFIQEVDFKQVYQSCSVFCDMIYTAEQARRKTVIACQAALAKRGVAVLIVPADVSASTVHNDVSYAVHVSDPVVRPSDGDLAEIAEILNKGENIAVYGGSGCHGAHTEILAVAEKLKAPIAHTSRAKDFLEHDNPYNIGMTGMLGNEAGYHALLNCDTLLMLGADFAWRQFYPDKAKIVQVDIDPTHLGRRHPVTKGVVGGVKETLEALLPKLNERSDSSFRDAYLRRYAKYKEANEVKIAAGRDGSIPGSYLTKVISQHAAKDALFTADDGTPAAWAYRHIETNGQRRIFASLLHGTMANGMPSSIGLQKSQPDRQVICLAGDGGISMLFGDLMTIVQQALPIKIAVFDNGKLGFVEIEQKAEGMLDTFTKLKNPNFAEVARALGLWGQTVSKAEQLEDAVKVWLAEPGPALLHVHVNPMQLVMPPFTAVEPAIGMALYTTRAVLHGRGGDVWEMVKENFL